MMTTIGIAGGSASGKTTVAKRLVEFATLYGSVAYIRLDDYYHDLSHLPMDERRLTNVDHPDALDFDLLITHLIELQNGHAVQKPVYDFVTYTRTGEYETITPSAVIIVEGILTLAVKRLRDLFNIKIFVDTDDDIRFIRRLNRDTKKRGRTVDMVVDHYLATVKPMHDQFVEPSRRFADLIIPEGGQNSVAIDMLTTKIKSIITSETVV